MPSSTTTLLISTLISIFLKPILVERYLLPVAGVLWFVFAILIGKIENKKKLAILLVLILILTLGSASYDLNSSIHHEKHYKDYKLIKKLNKKNNIIIYTSNFAVLQFENNLYKTKGYTLNNTIKNCKLKVKSKLITEKEIEKIRTENKNKRIYLIQDNHREDVKLGKKVKIGQIWYSKMAVYRLK